MLNVAKHRVLKLVISWARWLSSAVGLVNNINNFLCVWGANFPDPHNHS